MRFRHHVHFLHTTAVDEVVNVATAPGCAQCGVDVADGHTQRLRFLLVDVDLVLRRIFQAVRTHADQQIRVFSHFAKQLVTRLSQFLVAQTALVNQLEVETGRRTQFNDRWQVKGEDHRIFNLREGAHCTAGDRFNLVLFARTFRPVFQRNEGDTGVLATTRKAKAVNRKHGFNVRFFFGEVVIRHFIQHFLGTFLRCTRRKLRHRQEYALVFIWQERAWQTNEQIGHAHHDDDIEQQITTGAAQNVPYAVGIVVRALIKHAVKPAEEPFVLAVTAFLNRFQHGCTQRRRQDQRHQHRQRHRRNDSDGELTVNRTGRAPEEGHRNKYGGQHHRDTDQRALDLAHGFTGCFLRRQTFFRHDALDVFYHHDGVIHQQADGEHHPEHRQGVYRVAKYCQYGEGSEQDDRYGDGWNQRRAEVLQEQIHHQEDQDDRFYQGFNHFVNRNFNEWRGVIRINDLQT